MSILLDSASASDAEVASALGFIDGITTNPALMRAETDDPLRQLAILLERFPEGEIYYQPAGLFGDLATEAEKAREMAPDRIVLKLLATPAGAAAAGAFIRRGMRVALTAVQTAQAMAVADSMGCTAVIPYVDRAMRDLRTRSNLIAELAAIRRGKTRIIAASIKNVGQFAGALTDGADAVSAPLMVLQELLLHPSAEEAAQEFAAAFQTRT